MNYNKVIFSGFITRDPELKYLPSQMAVAEFGIAANRKFKTASGEEREDVCFVDCVAYGKTGEAINKFFAKGKPIFIEGRLKYDQWEDVNSRGKRSKLSIVVDEFRFVGNREDGASPAPSRGNQRPANRSAPSNPISDEQQFKDDDIPF